MSYSYKGFFRYITQSGRGGIGISVIAFEAGASPWPVRLATVLNDSDVSGALYKASSMGALHLLLPDLLKAKGETEHKGKFHDLRYLQQYGGTLSMSFAVEKYSGGKLIELQALRDTAATVKDIDLVNQSHVWYTSLFLRLPSPTLHTDGTK